LESEEYKHTSGITVGVEPITPASKLIRGDLIAFEDLQKLRVVKRLVGFPDESIQVSDGDLFVNYRRYQKTISDFYSSSIHVSSWPEANDYCSQALSLDPWCVYESSSLWPRVGQRATRHASPILDELAVNPDEPFPFVPVQDIGLVMSVEVRPAAEFEVIIGIWSSGALRTIHCRFSKDECIATPGSQLNTNSGVTLRYEPVPENRDKNEMRFVVATVDGRVGVAVLGKNNALISSHYWQSYECLAHSKLLQEANCSAERPAVISVRSTHPYVNSIEIVRDIYYRGPNGEYEYQLPIVEAYHVLGDNVSIAADSRSEFAEGIDRKRISGRIIISP